MITAKIGKNHYTNISDRINFENVRNHLYNQFQDVDFDAQTGLPLVQLQNEVDLYLQSHPDQSRVLQKAHVFRILLTHGQISIDPQDWFAGKLNHGDLIRHHRDEILAEFKTAADRIEHNWSDRLEKLGAIRVYYLDLGHISPGWENAFAGGLDYLIQKGRAHRIALGGQVTKEQLDFYEAVEIVIQAVTTLAHRYSQHARQLIEFHPHDANHLEMIAHNCEQVPGSAPQTFHQALQFAWFMHELIEMEGEWVRSMGHFDRTLYPYYRADIDAGRLTPFRAKELIKFFWIKYHARTRGQHNGKNFVFGGQYPDGAVVDNELTYLALEAYEELNTPDPKLSVRFTPRTPEKLYRRVADLVRNGHNAFVLLNDTVAVKALVERGKILEDARFYLPIGCYEPAVEGKEVGCTMNLVVNLAKGVELALHNGVDPLSGEHIGIKTGNPCHFSTFNEFYTAYVAQMDHILTQTINFMAEHEKNWPHINPSPLIASTIDDCLQRGKDIGQGGAQYNSVGCTGVGLANAADSLLAIKKTVFEDKIIPMESLIDLLNHNFEGQPALRQYLLNRVPKWGTDSTESNAIAQSVAGSFCDKIHTFRNYRGGGCQASLFTLNYQWTMGKNTGALPDGRQAHESLAPGVGPTSGRDKKGVTALIHSVSTLDFTKTPNGAVLDVTLHPTAVNGEEGLDAFVNLIKTFFTQGGYAIQFNVFDNDKLLDAQLHPEQYATMQIRVTGKYIHLIDKRGAGSVYCSKRPLYILALC